MKSYIYKHQWFASKHYYYPRAKQILLNEGYKLIDSSDDWRTNPLCYALFTDGVAYIKMFIEMRNRKEDGVRYCGAIKEVTEWTDD